MSRAYGEQTVFEKSKAEFEELLLKNQVWKQYQHVLLLLLRLRQASSHPMLPTYAEEMRRLELMNAICEESAGLGTPAVRAVASEFKLPPISRPQTGGLKRTLPIALRPWPPPRSAISSPI